MLRVRLLYLVYFVFSVVHRRFCFLRPAFRVLLLFGDTPPGNEGGNPYRDGGNDTTG